MANLDSNTQYGSPTTPSSMTNLSGVVKAIQERTAQTSSNTVQMALNSHFNPTVAAGMFMPTQSTAPVSNDWTPPVNTPLDPSTTGTPT
jgi:hypothetical protein